MAEKARRSIREVKEAFWSLSEKERKRLLADLYRFSPEVQRMIDQRLFGHDPESYLEELKALTYDRFDISSPKDVVAREINSVLSQAKKAGFSDREMARLHHYLFEAYVVYIDMYGISDIPIENKCAMHLEKTLQLMGPLDVEAKRDLYEEILEILGTHPNMLNDSYYDILESWYRGQ